jgi:hypothetical protein
MNLAKPASLPDERVLEMAGVKLAELTGQEWRVESGPLLKGPGTVGVRMLMVTAGEDIGDGCLGTPPCSARAANPLGPFCS